MRQFMDLNGMQRMGLIKSIQQISIATTSQVDTAIITAVDPEHTVVLPGGDANNYVADGGAYLYMAVGATVVLTNVTTVTRDTGANPAATWQTRATVVEFHPGVLRSKQAGAVTIPSAGATGVTAVSPVDMNKAWLIVSRRTNASATDPARAGAGFAYLNTAIQVAASRYTNETPHIVIAFQLPEFN